MIVRPYEDQEKPQSGYSVSRHKFEPTNSRTQVSSVTARVGVQGINFEFASRPVHSSDTIVLEMSRFCCLMYIQTTRSKLHQISDAYLKKTVAIKNWIWEKLKNKLISRNICRHLFQNVLCLQAQIDSSWNLMAHGDARERKWKGNWRMGWVASTLHTTWEHGVSSINTADNAHNSAASSRLNWRPLPIWMDSSVTPKDEIWFLRVCHHISAGLYHFTDSVFA